jgi:hypothetical protein
LSAEDSVKGVEGERQEDPEDLDERKVGERLDVVHRLRERLFPLHGLGVGPKVLDEEHADRHDAGERMQLLQEECALGGVPEEAGCGGSGSHDEPRVAFPRTV